MGEEKRREIKFGKIEIDKEMQQEEKKKGRKKKERRREREKEGKGMEINKWQEGREEETDRGLY